jgi:cytochrome c553
MIVRKRITQNQMSIIEKVLLSLVITALTVGAAHADGDRDRGAILADTCLGCHGIPGQRNGYPSYRVPKLGGQHAEYLVLGMQGYKNLGRSHPTMRAQAATLSEQDMHDLAAYFVSHSDMEVGSETSSAQIARGKAKAAVCAACHGDTGLSQTPSWPILAGQHGDYLVESMAQYRNGQRDDPVMAGQLINLSDADIEDLAAFYSAQSGLFTATYDD